MYGNKKSAQIGKHPPSNITPQQTITGYDPLINRPMIRNIELFYTKASIFSQLRKSDKAIEQYKKALDHAEDFEKEDIQLQLAFEYENLSKYSFAIEHLQEILKTNHENETALYELGFCYDVSEKIEDGKAYFEEFVNLHPYSYIGWFNLGITFGKLKLYEKAIDAYDFAIAIMNLSNVDCKIKPIETKEYPTLAKRPHFSVLNKSKIKNDFKLDILYWRDALVDCISKLNNK